jgi:hypothetical protein
MPASRFGRRGRVGMPLRFGAPSARQDLTAIDAALTIAAVKNTPGRDGHDDDL